MRRHFSTLERTNLDFALASVIIDALFGAANDARSLPSEPVVRRAVFERLAMGGFPAGTSNRVRTRSRRLVQRLPDNAPPTRPRPSPVTSPRRRSPPSTPPSRTTNRKRTRRRSTFVRSRTRCGHGQGLHRAIRIDLLSSHDSCLDPRRNRTRRAPTEAARRRLRYRMPPPRARCRSTCEGGQHRRRLAARILRGRRNPTPHSLEHGTP